MARYRFARRLGTGGAVIERRIATTGFPYAVRYRSIDGVVVVIAVYHQHRQPDFGSDRLA